MKFNPDHHHRISIRLQGYDYTRAGLYFITLCCHDRAHLFGEVSNSKMNLNDAGKIAEVCWKAIPNHFPEVVIHEYVIMPNHIHGIIEISGGTENGPSVEAENLPPRANIDSPQRIPPVTDVGAENLPPRNPTPQRIPFKSPSKTIGSIIRGFKIGVTKWVRENSEVQKVWQRDYYEHIIRNEKSYQIISAYILNNPGNWVEDKFNKE